MLRYTATLLLLFCVVNARNNQFGMTVVDNMRKEFLQLEETLWNFVLDHVDNVLVAKERPPEVELIEYFEKFGDKLHEVNVDNKWWFRLFKKMCLGTIFVYKLCLF